MPTTSPDNIFFPDVSSPASEITNLSTMAASIQTALGFRTRFDFVWPTITERTAQTGMVDGSRGYQIDTGYDYRYNGTVWRNAADGLVPIQPVTVSGTGVSLGAGGQVVLTAMTSAQVNGIFSAEFDNYKIDVDIPTSSANITLNMMLSSGGTNDTSANYDLQALTGQSGTATAGQVSAGSLWGIYPGPSNGNRIMDVEIAMKRPFLAVPTIGVSTGIATLGTIGAATAYSGKMLMHRASTSFDGLGFTSTTGSVTGVIHIYGWNNGAK